MTAERLRSVLDGGGRLHPNAGVIDRLYRSFSQRDHSAMADCYAADAIFSDPVFPKLDRTEIAGMWRMFCEQGTDLALSWTDIEADDRRGGARWEARYTFRATGRSVVNRITADFTFRDGRIARHIDDFDFYRWSRMALGPLGVALGWTPMLQRRVQQQARGQLERFMSATS